ncbi:MAG: DUF1499 domain-containing protein [Labrys sp. (in: a-proteobacteria)]|jgi:hypothetical protein
MRRLVTEQPIWSARAARTIASFALMATLISVALLRLKWVETVYGLAALGASLAVALLAIVMALIAFVQIWRKGHPGAGRALSGLLIALLIAAPPTAFTLLGIGTPLINDITTDLTDPPTFAVAGSERGLGTNAIDYDPSFAAIQKAGYPEIQPLLLELPPDETFTLILRLADERNWRIVVQRPMPQGPEEGTGRTGPEPVARIEAVAQSLVLGFEDDVSIRLREVDGRTRVDMRSASRYGKGDQGVNAARVKEFLEAVRVNALIR